MVDILGTIESNGPIEVKSQKSKAKTMDSTTQHSNLWVSRVLASQHKEGRVYATLNGYRIDNFSAVCIC